MHRPGRDESKIRWKKPRASVSFSFDSMAHETPPVIITLHLRNSFDMSRCKILSVCGEDCRWWPPLTGWPGTWRGASSALKTRPFFALILARVKSCSNNCDDLDVVQKYTVLHKCSYFCAIGRLNIAAIVHQTGSVMAEETGNNSFVLVLGHFARRQQKQRLGQHLQARQSL